MKDLTLSMEVSNRFMTWLQEQVNQTFKNDQIVHPLSHEALDNKIREMRDMKNNEAVRHNQNLHSNLRKVTDEKLNEMKDQLVRAKAYLNLAPPGSNSHLVKELRLRVREIERVVDDATKDSDLSRRYHTLLFVFYSRNMLKTIKQYYEGSLIFIRGGD